MLFKSPVTVIQGLGYSLALYGLYRYKTAPKSDSSSDGDYEAVYPRTLSQQFRTLTSATTSFTKRLSMKTVVVVLMLGTSALIFMQGAYLGVLCCK